MDILTPKSEIRQKTYKERSRQARDLARVCFFLVVILAIAAAWSDEYVGPIMRDKATAALEWMEQTREELTSADGPLGAFFEDQAG